mmetsp:Transcript_93901/g.218254  ORF Transcript_93901/g.218254 Transcript_93901/m.218254 type:complete len:324 (-) Transcript_93901:406-1377(-)
MLRLDDSLQRQRQGNLRSLEVSLLARLSLRLGHAPLCQCQLLRDMRTDNLQAGSKRTERLCSSGLHVPRLHCSHFPCQLALSVLHSLLVLLQQFEAEFHPLHIRIVPQDNSCRLQRLLGIPLDVCNLGRDLLQHFLLREAWIHLGSAAIRHDVLLDAFHAVLLARECIGHWLELGPHHPALSRVPFVRIDVYGLGDAPAAPFPERQPLLSTVASVLKARELCKADLLRLWSKALGGLQCLADLLPGCLDELAGFHGRFVRARGLDSHLRLCHHFHGGRQRCLDGLGVSLLGAFPLALGELLLRSLGLFQGLAQCRVQALFQES